MLMKKAVRASLVRFCYMIHGVAGIFLTAYLERNSFIWFLAILVLVYMMEMYSTFSLNEDGEWKWFFPLVLIYLATVLPLVWILEVSLLNFRIELQDRLNLTDRDCIVRPTQISLKLQLGGCDDYNSTFSESERDIYDLKLNISTIYQQTLMLVLILGRWMLPKGGLTRDELSQLLLVYIGMAADMLEFSSETLKLQEIACNRDIYVAILAVWSWSLLQFTLGLTSTKRPRRRSVIMTEEETERWTRSLRELSGVFCGTALWALMTDVVLQDGPYLVLRLYLLVTLHVVDQSLIFFTVKNALLLLLQFYRLYVVMLETRLRARPMSQSFGESGIVGDVAMKSYHGEQPSQNRSRNILASISHEITME